MNHDLILLIFGLATIPAFTLQERPGIRAILSHPDVALISVADQCQYGQEDEEGRDDQQKPGQSYQGREGSPRQGQEPLDR